MKPSWISLVMFWLLTSSVSAGRWEAELPGGSYAVDTAQITSVSTHEYQVDGVARVYELTIATTSSVVARFYHIDPLGAAASGGRPKELMERAEERAGTLMERAGQEPVWKKVVKNYPTTTHAHTVEYCLANRAQVQKLFDSVMDAWKRNKDDTLRLRDE